VSDPKVKSQAKAKLPATERLAYNIAEFCDLVGISRSFFYTLADDAKPRMTKRGGRWLIPAEAAREWVSAGEVAS
jgi:excisionase family DNA binding protein